MSEHNEGQEHLPQQAPSTEVDGFDGYNTEVEGQESHSPRVIQGTRWSFGNNSIWIDGDDQVIPPDTEVVVVDVRRVVQKWIDQKPVETRFIGSGERMPDVEALNTAAPKSEWGKDVNGNPKGPYQSSHLVYMVDKTMARFTYPTSTVGGAICVSDLVTAVDLMRRLRPGACPVVTPKSNS